MEEAGPHTPQALALPSRLQAWIHIPETEGQLHGDPEQGERHREVRGCLYAVPLESEQ